jgi:CRP-like cAMP-binding protein
LTELQATAVAAKDDNNILMKNLVPLNALSEEHLGQLISRVRVERLKSGTFLFREGDSDHQHVYLLEGVVSLLSGTKEVDTVHSGSNTARFALAHQWPRKFSARARSDVQVVRIDSHTLSELLVRTQSQSYKVSDLEADAQGDWMSRVLSSRVFQQIPAANIQSVLRRMEHLDVDSGEVIVRQGEPGEFYYVIVQGSCSVTRFVDGRIQEVARLGPGDGFGEQALLSDGQRCGTVSMATRGALMRLPKQDFVELIKQPLIRTLKPGEAKSQVDRGATWLDVRAPSEFACAHLPDALNLPLEVLRRQLDDLDPEISYVVYGRDTGEGAAGAFLLRERGCEVAVLEDGITRVPGELLVRAEDTATGAEKDSDDMLATLPLRPESTVPVATEALAGEAAAARIKELENLLQETQARYHKALYQRVAEIRQLKQRIADLEDERNRLREELERPEGAPGESPAPPPPVSASTDLEVENQLLRRRIEALEAELDELQEVLQEASAEESSHQWERLRLESRLKNLEASLEEQTEMNRVLREENEQTLRRMESLRDELGRLRP